MFTKFKIFEMSQDEDETWKVHLDISKIWQLYENKQISISNFNEQYIAFFRQCKDLIVKKVNDDAWNKLEKIIIRLEEKKDNEKDSNSVWDDIYDWGDGNSVEITAIKNDF